jgi:hypothetical protein
MLHLNFSNVEELVFFDRNVQRLLPITCLVSSSSGVWLNAPVLSGMGKQAVLDFLNMLTEDDIAVLEDHFKEKIIVDRLNYSVALNYKVPLSESKICDLLCGVEGFGYFSTWRDDEHLYISFWR